MSLLDTLLLGYKVIVRKGVVSAQRPVIEFTGDNVTVTDDPINDRAIVAISAPVPAANSITNTMLAVMAEGRFKGRPAGAGTATPVDLTAAQAQEILQNGWVNISFGVNPSTAANAAIRLPHAMRGVSYRNNANNADVTMVSYGLVATDVGAFGNSASFHMRTEGAILRLRNNATDLMTFETAQIESVVPVWRFQRDVVTPNVNQENRSTAGACQPLVARAQGTTVASTAGGLLRLEGGRAGAGGAAGQVAAFGNVNDATFHEGWRVGSSGSAATLSFFGATPAPKPTITGTRADGAATGSLLTALATMGLLTDSSTPGTPGGGLGFVGCALQNTSFAATTTEAAVTFTSELADTNAFHDNGSNTSRITIPVGQAGLYEITANARATSGTATCMIVVRSNGTGRLAAASGGAMPADNGASITFMNTGSDGDYYELLITSSASQNFRVYFNIKRLT